MKNSFESHFQFCSVMSIGDKSLIPRKRTMRLQYPLRDRLDSAETASQTATVTFELSAMTTVQQERAYLSTNSTFVVRCDRLGSGKNNGILSIFFSSTCHCCLPAFPTSCTRPTKDDTNKKKERGKREKQASCQ